ncbi:DHH family phosphoesterase [Peptostreptococcus faecalis]|uniref:DHH family phosphoesterase n=1 Tax=Peptostreptococcus faecalis TaxID=2045015 RepID=UPI000C7CC7C4|nr:DHH family phosphoesterase [Peptostreptococcus faecalis]
MNSKNHKSDILDYIEYLSFAIILCLSIYSVFHNLIVGIGGLVFLGVLVFLFASRKKRDDLLWKKRMQEMSFKLAKLSKKSLLGIPLPICVLELNGDISWSNSSFDRMVGVPEGKTAIGISLDDLVGEITLRKILDESKVIEDEFEFKGRKYMLNYSFTKLNEDSNDNSSDYKIIVYWIDNTELEDLKQKYEDDREVVMIIEVDGYEDVIKSTPEENRSILSMKIEKTLSEIEAETKGLMKKIYNDRYILFMRKSEFKLIEKGKFAILDKARQIDCENSLPVSFSIGVGYGGNTIEETGDFASGAIDMVLGRGGDQVAIKNQEGYNFYGGKSKNFERKTKVRSRLIGVALKEIINQSDKILIMGHSYPDMDAMGAAVGIYDMCKFYGKKANIVLDNVNEAVEIFINRLKEKEYYEGLFISHERAIDMCDAKTLVVVLDTHRPSYTECEELLDISKRVVVIDHHRRGVEYIHDTILLFHEVYVSSTCEMVTELIQYTDNNIKINKLTAEGLLGGVYLDTKNFEFKTGVRTFEAAAFLRNLGADTLAVKKFFDSYAEDFLIKADIIKKTKIIDNKICISYSLEEINNINLIVAKAADELLNIKSIEASFVLGIKGDTVFISARSIGNINVHVIMEKLGGGGHIDIAGAQIKDLTISQAYDMLKDTIMEYLEEE